LYNSLDLFTIYVIKAVCYESTQSPTLLLCHGI